MCSIAINDFVHLHKPRANIYKNQVIYRSKSMATLHSEEKKNIYRYVFMIRIVNLLIL